MFFGFGQISGSVFLIAHMSHQHPRISNITCFAGENPFGPLARRVCKVDSMASGSSNFFTFALGGSMLCVLTFRCTNLLLANMLRQSAFPLEPMRPRGFLRAAHVNMSLETLFPLLAFNKYSPLLQWMHVHSRGLVTWQIRCCGDLYNFPDFVELAGRHTVVSGGEVAGALFPQPQLRRGSDVLMTKITCPQMFMTFIRDLLLATQASVHGHLGRNGTSCSSADGTAGSAEALFAMAFIVWCLHAPPPGRRWALKFTCSAITRRCGGFPS